MTIPITMPGLSPTMESRRTRSFMWARIALCIAGVVAAAACASTPATTAANSLGNGRYELSFHARAKEQIDKHVSDFATKTCGGAYSETRRETVVVCADTPVDQCPKDLWSVTIQCGEKPA
jgi:hypothetical protein